MTTKKIDKDYANKLLREVHAAIEEVAKRHGLVIASRGRGSYTTDSVRCPAIDLAMPALDASGTVDALGSTPEGIAFTTRAFLFGLKPEHLGAVIQVPGHGEAKVTGLLPKGKKYPFVIDVEGGKRLKVAEQVVIDGLVKAGLLADPSKPLKPEDLLVPHVGRGQAATH